MTASDYAINFPYGSTSPPYSAASPHRGDDRPCPAGTPIVINGTQIGLTGATGKVTGPHLHIQEWSGGYANTRKPQNAFQPGTVTNIDPSGTQGDGSFGKFITIQAADGWNDTYCHLSEIDVKIGQVIGDKVMDRDGVVLGFQTAFNRSPGEDEIKTYLGMPTNQFLGVLLGNNLDFRTKAANYDPLAKEYADYKAANPPSGDYILVTDPLYKKK